jgi:hypothetical protein
MSVTEVWRTTDGRHAVELADGSWALQASAGQWVRLEEVGNGEYEQRSWACDRALRDAIAVERPALITVADLAKTHD